MSHLNENDLMTISSRWVIRPSCHRGKPLARLVERRPARKWYPAREDDRHGPESIPEDRSLRWR